MAIPALPAPTSALTVQLLRLGHVVVACHGCGRATPADVDHDGDRLPACSRRYCSEGCRDDAERVRAVTGPTRRHQAPDPALVHRHQLEAAGQLSVVPGPLPALPRTPDLELT